MSDEHSDLTISATEDQEHLWNELINHSAAPSPKEVIALEQLLIHKAPTRSLEKIGSQLTLAHLLALAERWENPDVAEKWEGKLSSLLVGLPHALMRQFLLAATPQQLKPFLSETSGEPLLHQLNLTVHEEEHRLEEIARETLATEEAILTLDFTHATYAQISLIFQRLASLSDLCRESMQLLEKALLLAWNCPRRDLIERLSTLKERFQRYDSQMVGAPARESKPASGLYFALQQQFDRVYHSASQPMQIDALHDDEPAIEALAKFSIWYLEDYYAIGLLPSLHSLEELNQQLKKLSKEERSAYRSSKFMEAKQTLESAGLSTVKDLKRSHIFSAAALKDYLRSSGG